MVKQCRRDPKIGMQSQFGSNLMMEFEAKISPKLGCPTIHPFHGSWFFWLSIENLIRHWNSENSFLIYTHLLESFLPDLLELEDVEGSHAPDVPAAEVVAGL